MSFLVNIRSFLYSIASFFWNLYVIVSGWIWPFNQAAGLFRSIGTFIDNIVFEIWQFDVWLQGVVSQIGTYLTWANLTSWFSQFLDMITGAWNWVINWWNNVWNAINSWWNTVYPIVQSWISSATQGLSGLLSSWQNFVTVTLPSLVNWQSIYAWFSSQLGVISGLIDSAFTIRTQFWAGWQEVRDNVFSFLSNPLDWLEQRFTDWFFGGK